MLRKCIFTALALLLVTIVSTTAFAREALLQWDNGVVGSLETVEGGSQYVQFNSMSDWSHNFAEELQVYCETFGDVSNLQGAVIVWGPQTEENMRIEDKPDSMVVYGRSFFKLSDLPKTAGWVSLPLEPTELPRKFGVSLYTYSNKDRGVKVGLSTPTGDDSHSASEETGKEIDGRLFKFRKDEREWLMRLKVRESFAPVSSLSSQELSGKTFAFFDDGVAEGFATTQRFGPLVKFTNSAKRNVKGVYVNARVEGDWFGTQRNAGVWLLDKEFKIIKKVDLKYALYAPDPSWNFVSLEGVQVPTEFYVLVEPASKPDVQLLVGYDSSGANKASSFGTPGAPKDWMTDAPQDTTNWLIRVEYTK